MNNLFHFHSKQLYPYRVYSLLIDGMSLCLVMKHCAERFRDTAMKCQAVLCCRLSPIQKCEVVKLMKTLPDSPITAAIGDGANDVSMIREAHVGLGILGKEGRQAALCSDYSFTNFYMLKKMILVHGHFYSYRFSLLVLYFFYKNLVFMLIQVRSNRAACRECGFFFNYLSFAGLFPSQQSILNRNHIRRMVYDAIQRYVHFDAGPFALNHRKTIP